MWLAGAWGPAFRDRPACVVSTRIPGTTPSDWHLLPERSDGTKRPHLPGLLRRGGGGQLLEARFRTSSRAMVSPSFSHHLNSHLRQEKNWTVSSSLR